MAQVLIVSRTSMSGGNVCVGGLVMHNARNVRLLTSSGGNQPGSAPYQVGEFWDLTFTNKPNCVPPHIEDVLVLTASKTGASLNKANDIRSSSPVYTGPLSATYQGCLVTPRGRAWHIDRSRVPDFSVCFWETPQVLTFTNLFNKSKYHYNTFAEETYLPFVGTMAASPMIAAGTIVRLSLARWWVPPDQQDDHCYLQLSGWY